MKKTLFIFIVVLQLSIDCYCQWYSRRYGVSDLTQLSQKQLNEALVMAKDGIGGGALLSVAGAAGIYGGIRIFRNAASGDLETSFEGLGLTGISVLAEITGLMTLFISRSRMISIKKVINNAEFRLGTINYPEYSRYRGSSCSLPGFSVTFHF
jgi:hypothetical protein